MGVRWRVAGMGKKKIWQSPSICLVTNLYNILYNVNTKQYISTVMWYIYIYTQSGYIMATCFDRKWSSSGQERTFLRYRYLKNVLCWPEDDRLRSKHVAVTWPDCIYNITVLIYCCVVTVYNTLYKKENFCKLFCSENKRKDTTWNT